MDSNSIPISIPNPNRIASPTGVYFDREKEANLIMEFLKGGQENPSSGKVCLVYGFPGIGKTDLCRVVANRLQDIYSDAQIYIKIGGEDTGDLLLYKVFEIIIHIFDPFAHLTDDLATLHAGYLSALDGKKVFIILDDMEVNENLELLVPPPTCVLLITAKMQLKIQPAMSLHLAGLSSENSEMLLTNTCPRIGGFASEISHIGRNNPFCLHLVAGYLAENSAIKVEQCIDEMKQHYMLEDDLDEGLLAEWFVGHFFERLRPGEKNFLSQLALFTDGFKAEEAGQITRLISDGIQDEKIVQTHLRAFVRMDFLELDEVNGYYRMPSTVQDVIFNNLGNSLLAQFGLAQLYANLTEEFISLAARNADGFLLALLVFDEHRSNIRKVLKYLRESSDGSLDPIRLELFSLIDVFGQCRFLPIAEIVPAMETSLDAALRLNRIDKLLSVLGKLSKAYLALGNTERAQDYDRVRENVIEQGQDNQPNQAVEEFRVDRNAGLAPVMATNSKSALTEFNLKQFSIEKTKIVLTGIMGTGKTTVGKLLADYLNCRFIDTDELIESKYGRSIADIFSEFGEEAFREMERKVVREIGDLEAVVISTGGRLMLDPENVNILGRNSRVFCLVATPDEIITRVSNDVSHVRPLLSVPNPKERIVELLQDRNEKYRRFPQISTDEKEPMDIASGLVEFINTDPKSIVIGNPQKSYEYIVGAGLLPFIRQLTGIDSQIVVITDDVVKGLYGPSCASLGHMIEIPSGRHHKSLDTVQLVYDQLLDIGFDRSGTIISLGGSVVGDIAGYVAATYMRGVDLIRCPTSLMSMVDTSVGGKTSIDLPQGKNIIGVYKQPVKILADVATLQTLPKSDFASGMAEVIKHGLVVESDLLDQIEQLQWVKNWGRSPSYIGELQRLVAQAIQVKINIVQADPFEQGLRSILNLGHTFAYAIEQESNNAYRHGEAVSIGMIAAANLSTRLGYCDKSLQDRIETILQRVNLPTRIPQHLAPNALLQAMQRDKKKQAGQLRFVLISKIGHAFVSDAVPAEAVLETISAVSN